MHISFTAWYFLSRACIKESKESKENRQEAHLSSHFLVVVFILQRLSFRGVPLRAREDEASGAGREAPGDKEPERSGRIHSSERKCEYRTCNRNRRQPLQPLNSSSLFRLYPVFILCVYFIAARSVPVHHLFRAIVAPSRLCFDSRGCLFFNSLLEFCLSFLFPGLVPAERDRGRLLGTRTTGPPVSLISPFHTKSRTNATKALGFTFMGVHVPVLWQRVQVRG